MAKQDAKTATPRLRFPEFRGLEPWIPRPLIGLADKRVKWSFAGGPFGSNLKASDYAFHGVRIIQLQNIGDGEFIPDYKIYTSISKADELQSCNIYPGEILLSKMGDPVGRACIVPESESRYVMCSDGIRLVVDKAEFSRDFVFFAINFDGFRRRVEAASTGSTRKRIGLDVLKQLPLDVPQLAEQRKVADCLTSLNEVIAAQRRKVEALKAHKRGLMQQLFPREGETRPRLRFPEFRDAPEWRETPLGDLVDLLSGYPFDGKDIVEDSSGEPLMRGINITEGAVRHSVEIDRYYLGSVDRLEKFRLRKNDLVIGMDGSKVGKNSALIGDEDVGALLIQRVARLRAESAELMAFIFQQVHSPRFRAYVDRINTSSGIPHISARQIKDYPIHFTSEAEQQRIADCLSSLDTQITAETHQLAALKSHKQGLMQQLFPAPEAAGA